MFSTLFVAHTGWLNLFETIFQIIHTVATLWLGMFVSVWAAVLTATNPARKDTRWIVLSNRKDSTTSPGKNVQFLQCFVTGTARG